MPSNQWALIFGGQQLCKQLDLKDIFRAIIKEVADSDFSFLPSTVLGHKFCLTYYLGDVNHRGGKPLLTTDSRGGGLDVHVLSSSGSKF